MFYLFGGTGVVRINMSWAREWTRGAATWWVKTSSHVWCVWARLLLHVQHEVCCCPAEESDFAGKDFALMAAYVFRASCMPPTALGTDAPPRWDFPRVPEAFDFKFLTKWQAVTHQCFLRCSSWYPYLWKNNFQSNLAVIPSWLICSHQTVHLLMFIKRSMNVCSVKTQTFSLYK